MDFFPILHTRRLLLRKLDPEDLSSLVKYANNKKISDYVLNIPYPYREPDAVFRISFVYNGFKNKQRYVFAIIHKEREELVGEAGIHLDNPTTAQLGYWVGEPFWNTGIASEAVERILAFGFEKLNLELIYATCHAENPASGKVLLKNGMKEHSMTGSVIQYVKKRQD